MASCRVATGVADTTRALFPETDSEAKRLLLSPRTRLRIPPPSLIVQCMVAGDYSMPMALH